LLATPDVVLALHMPVFMYLVNRNDELVDLAACFNAHKATPDMGTILSLALFLSRLCAFGVIIM
jgi:hypothetical protein